jgi:hypothetical protein
MRSLADKLVPSMPVTVDVLSTTALATGVCAGVLELKVVRSKHSLHAYCLGGHDGLCDRHGTHCSAICCSWCALGIEVWGRLRVRWCMRSWQS